MFPLYDQYSGSPVPTSMSNCFIDNLLNITEPLGMSPLGFDNTHQMQLALCASTEYVFQILRNCVPSTNTSSAP